MLRRKVLRDIRKSSVQFAAIFLMMLIGCFLFSGITGEWMGLKKHFQEYINSQNMADAWGYGSFTADDLNTLRADKRISEAEGRMLLPMGFKGNDNASLDCYVTEDDQVSSLYITKGTPFDGTKKGIWLDSLFAEENSIETGDEIELTYKGMNIKGKVSGLAHSPEYIYGATEEMMPNHKNHGFAYLSPALLPDKNMLSFSQIAVKTESGHVKALLRDILQEPDLKVVTANEHPSVSMIKDEIDQHKSMGTIFSAAFLFIAVMIAMTTMHRLLKNQRTQIGILKALGFSKRKLFLHYLSHNCVICLTGALAGYLLGYRLLAGLIYRFMGELYVLPEWGGYLPSGFLALPVGCTLLCMIISFFICRKYLKGSASEILYGGEQQGRMIELPGVCRKLPFSSRWNLRDVERNRLRSFMTLCGVLGCTALLFCAFILFDTFTYLTDWTFSRQQTYQCKITELPKEEGQEELLKWTDGEYLMETSAVIKKDGKEKEVTLTVPESSRFIKLAENLNTFVKIKDGVALSKKTADSLNIKEGDMVSFKPSGNGKYQSSKVEAIIRTPFSQGITMMKKAYDKADAPFVPTAIVGNEPENGFGKYEEQCTVSLQKDLVKGFDSMMDGMIMMISILIMGAVILGSVMLYNLGVLSYLERYREFATMKVLGFSDRKIRRIMIQQNVWLSAAGILTGLPAGYGLFVYLLSTMPDSMDVPVYIRISSWILSAAGTLLLSWLISRLVSRKIRGINMVEALKAKE